MSKSIFGKAVFSDGEVSGGVNVAADMRRQSVKADTNAIASKEDKFVNDVPKDDPATQPQDLRYSELVYALGARNLQIVEIRNTLLRALELIVRERRELWGLESVKTLSNDLLEKESGKEEVVDEEAGLLKNTDKVLTEVTELVNMLEEIHSH